MAVRSYTLDLEKASRPAPPREPKKEKGAVVIDARPPVAAAPVPAPAPPPLPPTLPHASIAPVPPAGQPVTAPVESNIHIVEHPLVQQALTLLRAKDTPSRHFRQLSNQLLVLLLVEAARRVPTRTYSVSTSAGDHLGVVVARPIILLTLARHGLGLAHNLSELFPDIFIGSISLEKNSDGPAVNARIHLANAPALADAHVVLFDPVVSSGGTAQAALNLVQRCGTTRVSFISLLFSLPGLSHLQTAFPKLPIWTAGIDTNLDVKRGPLPGVGDFAERLYGSKGRANFTTAPW